MASAESINVEFDTGRREAGGRQQTAAAASPSGGSGGGSGLWNQAKYHLDPSNHTLLENVLASIVFVLFFVMIALAATHGGGSGGGGGSGLGATCQSQECLLRSAATIAYANLSASPCDDFYKYACGLARYSMRMGPTLVERTVIGDVARENEDRLEELLRGPVARDTPSSYERKLKTFFATCNNDFLTERIRGAPLALYLRPDLYLLNASTIDRFDLNEMLLKAYMAYGADVFFEYFVMENFLDNDKYTISVTRGGLGMPTSSYLSESETSVKHREAYQLYIRTIALFLVNDAEADTVAPGSLGRVDEFVADVLEIETELANIYQNSASPEKPPMDPSNMPTLKEMDATYPPFSWSGFFGESFRPNAPETTRVAVQNPDYLRKVAEYVGQRLPSAYPLLVYKRKLSNYMNWRIISRYVGDLSSGYVHARREFEAVLAVSPYVYESQFDYCFRKARHFMRHGVSALFASHHFSHSKKAAIDAIYKTLQTELKVSVDRLAWVDAAARAKTKDKIGAIIDRVGYSTAEISDAYLDKFYETLTADSNDYLLDMTISHQNFHRESQGAMLGKQADRDLWDGATYDTNLHMNNQKAQLTVPAGILQWPFYDAGLPVYVNYAAIGQLIAAELVKSFDATGQLFDKDGNLNPIWSTDTTLNYVQRASCLNQTFSAMRAGPYVVSGQAKYVNIDTIILRQLRNVIAAADGLRVAMRTYQSLYGDSSAPLPLAQLNNRQTFFVVWAQTLCYHRDPEYSITKAERLRAMPEEILVNGILSTMPEFAQTFSCPSSSQMAKPTACEGVFYV